MTLTSMFDALDRVGETTFFAGALVVLALVLIADRVAALRWRR